MVVDGRLLNSGEVHKAFAMSEPACADDGGGGLEGRKGEFAQKIGFEVHFESRFSKNTHKEAIL
jgi:hypothetical protein